MMLMSKITLIALKGSVLADRSGTKQNKMLVLSSGLALVILWPAGGKLGFSKAGLLRNSMFCISLLRAGH